VTEDEVKAMVETVRERVGFELDTPETGWFWEWYMELAAEDATVVDKVFDAMITYTATYLEEKRGH
jgi:hypothetical protein